MAERTKSFKAKLIQSLLTDSDWSITGGSLRLNRISISARGRVSVDGFPVHVGLLHRCCIRRHVRKLLRKLAAAELAK